MENDFGARNSGPVALMPPPPTAAFTTKPVRRDLADGAAAAAVSCGAQSVGSVAVQLVCSNPGCTVATWMDADDWEARVASAQRQRRGWNGDEDEWRPDHAGPAAVALPPPPPAEQLVCPCGRGWRRRATLPSAASPAAVAARLDRLQQLRLMRRSEPMLAAAAPSHLPAAGWPSGPCQWPDAGPWMSRMVQPPIAGLNGLCSQAIGAERACFRPDYPPVSRHRVFSEPEIYDSTTSRCVGVGVGARGPNSAASIQQSWPLHLVNGYHHHHQHLQPPLPAPGPPSSTPDFSSLSLRLLNSVDVLVQGAECGGPRQRNLTPKRPSRPDAALVAPEPPLSGARPADAPRRDGASPDSLTSDGGSSSGSTGSERRRPSTGGPGGRLPGSNRGNIFRQRTASELASFRSLSLHCNAYEVQTAGDDAPYGKV